MTAKPKKLLSATPAKKSSVLEKFFREIKTDEKNADGTVNSVMACEIPIYNIRWYPSNKSCVKISTPHHKPQNTPPLMVRKAEWRR